MSSNIRNRTFWNAGSRLYQETHGAVLSERPAAWGVWRVPEAELGVLGDVDDRHILELGCGAAQWSVDLRNRGARAIGLDFSSEQLTHARHAFASARSVPLVQSDAESLPFRDAVFDIVFCDHGATTFAAPERIVAEVSRVLRPAGLFAFCMSTPIRDVCVDHATWRVTAQLANDYFALSVLDDGETVEYQLTYGAWIRLFHQHGLNVEDLIELRAPEDAMTTFSDFAPREWARRWPAEHIWKVKKR